LDALGIFLASYFQYFVGGALPLFLLVKDKKARIKNLWFIGLAFLAALVSRYIFTSALHHVFFRPRPFAAHEILQLIVYDGAKSSFPSGHAAFFFALATVVFLYNRKAGWCFFTASFLISLARIYVGVHYPSDIIGGALIGVLVGWGVWGVFKRTKLGEKTAT